MSIDYDGIEEIIGINTKIIGGRENPLIDLRLTYRRKNGVLQEHVYPTTPKEVYEALEVLLRRNLILKDRVDNLKTQVNGLERRIFS